jgi:hypothetical protein
MSNIQLNWHETTASFSEMCKVLNKSVVAEKQKLALLLTTMALP